MRVVAMSFACMLHLAMSSCALHHHVFKNLHPSGFPQFRPLSVVSPTTLARVRGMSEIVFYKWPEKCSWIELKVGVRSYYTVDRPPVKFHRIRSSFDSPAVKYSGNSSRSNVGRFLSPETVAGPPSLLFSQLETIYTDH